MRLVGIAFVGIVAACGRIDFDANHSEPSGDGGSGDAPLVDGFTAVRAYGDTTCAIYRGTLYCWGGDGGGQLGDVGSTAQPLPQMVPIPSGHVDDFTIGEAHACAIVGARLYCWGMLQSLTAVNLIAIGVATSVAAGRNFTCAIFDGAIACFGENDVGQLGRGTMGGDQWMPQALSLAGPVAVDAGDDHACVSTSGAEAYCWGHDDDGVIGANFSSPQALVPTHVLDGVTATPRIAGWHACALSSGTLQCWGEGDHGELGNTMVVATNSEPQTIDLGFAIAAVDTGGGAADFDATCAVRADDGGVACWGAGLFGRLGDATTANRASPVRVAGLPAGVRATGVAIGYDHACAVLADGTLWCWGKNVDGQLGRGTQTDHEFVPMPVVAPN